MAEIFFNSDSHVEGSEREGEPGAIPGFRGCASEKEHLEYIADRWVSSVRKNDVVFDLGDLTIRDPQTALDLYARLPGEIHLISGNHDETFPAHKKAYNKVEKYMRVFKSVSFAQKLKTHGHELFLSHMPYTGEHDDRYGNPKEDRYPEFRFPNLGLWNVHGHVHHAWKVRDNMINVGVDQWPDKLASIYDIIEIINASKETN